MFLPKKIQWFILFMQIYKRWLMYDLIVIGGGASGLVTAIVAEKRGKSVVILEKEDKVGKKILVTGNGKCNLSSVCVEKENYNTEFVSDIIKEDVLKFFDEIGLVTKCMGERIYPYHESASGVVNLLRKNLKDTQIITNSYVTDIVITEKGFKVNGYEGKNVVLCTGSKATKGTESYGLYQKFGHKLITPKASIVPLITQSTAIKGLANLRAKVSVSLIKNNVKIYSQTGEILFKNDGLSGICSMMLSTYIARNGGEYDVSIDFAPDMTEEKLDIFIKNHNLDGMLLKAISEKIKSVAKEEKREISNVVKDFRVKNVFNGTLKSAQVACGGLDIKQFSENLESKLVKGLYACGEVLDVDGECGGFNLHFAFASGLRVGKNI